MFGMVPLVFAFPSLLAKAREFLLAYLRRTRQLYNMFEVPLHNKNIVSVLDSPLHVLVIKIKQGKSVISGAYPALGLRGCSIVGCLPINFLV